MPLRLPRLPRRAAMPEPLASAGVRYRIGDVSIMLPAGHRLPEYQADFPLYDAFLPFIASAVSGPELIVDLGANVGDTAVAMAQACVNPILAVEPEPSYYALLVANARLVRPGIVPLSALIGTGLVAGRLVSDGTTAEIRADGTGVAITETLDDVVDRMMPADGRVALVKVSVSGHTWDVLASGESMLRRSEPILFFDNFMPDASHLGRFEALYRRLGELGYESLWVFDNFGGLVLADASFANVESINEYVADQEWGRSARTIYYTFTLAATSRRTAEARAAVTAYRRHARDAQPKPG
jgi:FkbM family methyltransferase